MAFFAFCRQDPKWRIYSPPSSIPVQKWINPRGGYKDTAAGAGASNDHGRRGVAL